MAAPKKIDEELMREREEAWVGDAVLALFVRRLILKEQGKMDGEMFIRCTSNDFLRNIGNPTSVEALIGGSMKARGLRLLLIGWNFNCCLCFANRKKITVIEKLRSH